MRESPRLPRRAMDAPGGVAATPDSASAGRPRARLAAPRTLPGRPGEGLATADDSVAGSQAPALYLASRSPRRRELLDQVAARYRLVDVEVDERHVPGETPGGYVTRVAIEKALAAGAALGRRGVAVLAADTAVVLDGTLLGKPRDGADAERMLASLSGREHRVLTAVALARDGGHRSALSESRVRLRVVDARERAAYVATGEPLDKAGAYAIQGRAALFVAHLDGSYSGVMGLPLFETAALLREAGIELLGS